MYTDYHTYSAQLYPLSIIFDKKRNWYFTWWDWNQISHFPGMNLSGMRSAYRQAPVTYKAPISNAWYKAPWSMTCVRPYILIKWIIGAAEMNPNATKVDALNDLYSCKTMNYCLWLYSLGFTGQIQFSLLFYSIDIYIYLLACWIYPST